MLRRGGARRTDGVKASTSGFWTVDPVAREAISPKGGRLRISPHEICLLHLFLDNPGVVFTPETAGERIPTLKRDTATGFRTAVSRLRRKLGGLDCGEVIRNVRGAGYMYAAARH